MAFGTGQHPTTRMCLQALQDLMKPGDYVLDLGAGSGILAIAAVALGSGPVVATDTEEQAVASALANARLNGMESQILVLAGSIDAIGDAGPFDFVLANINAATIIALSRQLAAAMKPGAPLAAGGVIAEREPAVRAALEDAGLKVERVLQEGDWRTFIARRP
jgi:ribosomal protein L11 methyltransferase